MSNLRTAERNAALWHFPSDFLLCKVDIYSQLSTGLCLSAKCVVEASPRILDHSRVMGRPISLYLGQRIKGESSSSAKKDPLGKWYHWAWGIWGGGLVGKKCRLSCLSSLILITCLRSSIYWPSTICQELFQAFHVLWSFNPPYCYRHITAGKLGHTWDLCELCQVTWGLSPFQSHREGPGCDTKPSCPLLRTREEGACPRAAHYTQHPGALRRLCWQRFGPVGSWCLIVRGHARIRCMEERKLRGAGARRFQDCLWLPYRENLSLPSHLAFGVTLLRFTTCFCP